MKGSTSGGGSSGGSGRGLSDAELRAILGDMPSHGGGPRPLGRPSPRAPQARRGLGGLGSQVRRRHRSRPRGQGHRPGGAPSLPAHHGRLVDVTEDLAGKKAVLRERLRAIDRGETQQGRWSFLPLAVPRAGASGSWGTGRALAMPMAANRRERGTPPRSLKGPCPRPDGAAGRSTPLTAPPAPDLRPGLSGVKGS